MAAMFCLVFPFFSPYFFAFSRFFHRDLLDDIVVFGIVIAVLVMTSMSISESNRCRHGGFWPIVVSIDGHIVGSIVAQILLGSVRSAANPKDHDTDSAVTFGQLFHQPKHAENWTSLSGS